MPICWPGLLVFDSALGLVEGWLPDRLGLHNSAFSPSRVYFFDNSDRYDIFLAKAF